MLKAIIYKIKKQSILFFLFKLITLFAIIFILDFAIGNTLNYFYFKQSSGLQYRTTYSIEKTEADVLIFGSSRANHHYHPDVCEQRLKMSYYNVGRDGSDILYHTAVLRGVLNRYRPKMIILDINPWEFKKIEGGYDRLSSLLPYYNKHPEMQSIIGHKSKYEKYKLLSSIYPYNSSLFTIAIGNTEYNKNRKGDIKGYLPLTNIWNNPIQEETPEKYELDSLKLKYFESFILDCIQSQIKLFVVCSPSYKKYIEIDNSILKAIEIANKHTIQFLNFSNDTTFENNHKLFADKEHLNDSGANVFTKRFIEAIGRIK